MNLRKTAAGVVLTTGLLLGGATTAFAADTPSPRPPASAECKAAAKTLRELRALDARLRADYARLVRARNAADRAGKTELVKRLDAQLAKMRTAHAKVVAKIKTAAEHVREECAPTSEG